MVYYLLIGFVSFILGIFVTLIGYRFACAGVLNVLKSEDNVIDIYLASDKSVEWIESHPFVKLKVVSKDLDSRK